MKLQCNYTAIAIYCSRLKIATSAGRKAHTFAYGQTQSAAEPWLLRKAGRVSSAGVVVPATLVQGALGSCRFGAMVTRMDGGVLPGADALPVPKIRLYAAF